LVNCLHNRQRTRCPLTPGDDALDGLLQQLQDPHSDLSRQWDQEHDERLIQGILEWAENNLTAYEWDVFKWTAVEGQATADVGRELGRTPAAILVAKGRALAAIRQEFKDLLDDASLV